MTPRNPFPWNPPFWELPLAHRTLRVAPLRDGVRRLPIPGSEGPYQIFVGESSPRWGRKKPGWWITEHLNSASEQQILIQEAAQRSWHFYSQQIKPSPSQPPFIKGPFSPPLPGSMSVISTCEEEEGLMGKVHSALADVTTSPSERTPGPRPQGWDPGEPTAQPSPTGVGVPRGRAEPGARAPRDNGNASLPQLPPVVAYCSLGPSFTRRKLGPRWIDGSPR